MGDEGWGMRGSRSPSPIPHSPSLLHSPIAAFERAIANRFSAEPSMLYPVGRIWLPRAHARKGDTDAARRAYDDAFAFWKNADTDLPILVQPRKEYAALPNP